MIMATKQLIKSDQLDRVVDQLVMFTGIEFLFDVNEKERKDMDRCFILLRDMAGYVKEKLATISESQNLMKDCVKLYTATNVQDVSLTENANVNLIEMAEEDPLITKDDKKYVKSSNLDSEERPAKKAKVQAKPPLKVPNNVKKPLQTTTNTTVFKPEWTDPKSLLFDINGDRLSDYLTPVDSSPSEAFCRACRANFSVGVKGVGQVYQHARGSQHRNSIKSLR